MKNICPHVDMNQQHEATQLNMRVALNAWNKSQKKKVN